MSSEFERQVNKASYEALMIKQPGAIAAIKGLLDAGETVDNIYWAGYHMSGGGPFIAGVFANAAQHILDGGEDANAS